MYRNGRFDHTKVRAEVTTSFRDRSDQIFTDVSGQRMQLLPREIL
jgi:hypothetical protein